MPEYESLEVLLVEDNPSDAELALHALRKSKIANHVLHLQDGAEALDFMLCRGQFATRNPDNRPSLILLDLKLPKIDGLQVLKELKANVATRAIPVILLTSSQEERDLIAGYQHGVNSYIQKPVSFSEFQDVVHKLGFYWLIVNRKPPAAAFATA
jgi:two-component system, response regulator